MKELFVLLFLVGSAWTVWSQEGIISFAYDAQGQKAKNDVPGYKYETTKLVFDSLVAGQGDFRLPPPTLLMESSEMRPAWAVPKRGEIGIEELAYDICTSFGPDSLNALAALLSHELVHYYEKHDWTSFFVEETKDHYRKEKLEPSATAQQLEKLEERLKLEAQADYQGGFWAQSIGFDVLGIMPELLKKIYGIDGYDIEEETPGYPSLEERIATSELATNQLRELQIVFETATYLNLLEQYDAADKYYHRILRDFQSRDIYNNAGVTALLASLSYFSKKELSYGLPVELDPKSRLQTRTTRDTDLNRKKERENRIKKAIGYFEQALELDKQYAPAFLNLAAANVLLQNWEDAEYLLRKADKAAPGKKLSSDLLVLKGVIAAQQEDLERARGFWHQARDMDNYLAVVNLQILETGPLQPVAGVFGFLAKKEKIAEVVLEEFMTQNGPDQMVTLDNRTVCGLHQRPEFVIYSHSVDYGEKEFISVQVVDETFTGKSLEGIAIGDSREKLFEKYGEPERQVQGRENTYLIYPSRNMLFSVIPSTGINGWAVYRIK